MTSPFRFPAEWEPQAAVLIAWPHAGTDWAPRLEAVEATYTLLVAAIADRQAVVIAVANPEVLARAKACLATDNVNPDRVRWIEVEYDDTWLRDSGPIALTRAALCADDSAQFNLLDFRFTGWGGKYGASRDDALASALFDAGVFANSALERVEFALEGGAIETDGAGTLLSTWRCLHERHPTLDRQTITAQLQTSFRQTRVLWLDHGYLEGDDTDAHIDTLARFAGAKTLVYQACSDPSDPHFAELGAMGAELESLRDANGQPYRCLPLPWAQPIRDGERRLAASYANFLIINGAVLMPSYDDPADTQAAEILQFAFPDRDIVSIPCRSLIWQNGSLHCITMQLPAGSLA
ncbi:MAG: agmatine deiminase family protein [Pseudomarimonas sp.]